MTENAAHHDPVLIVGAVTWDIVSGTGVDGERRPGGVVTFAARVASAFGVRAYVLVSAGADADLAAFAEHDLAVVPVEHTMTLEHRHIDGVRHQRVVARPDRMLRPSDRPDHWPAPRTMILGTLLPGDIDLDTPEETALIAQGLQRVVTADGTIEDSTAPSAALLDAARPGVTVYLSAEETARWGAGEATAVDTLAARSKRVVRTMGAAGAEIRTGEATRFVPALRADVLDTTGAGDVFASALILAMRAGEDVAERLAAACAAACVERIGSAPLPARTELEARAGLSGDVRTQGDR